MATKAPTGLAIARDGLNFTCTWKLGQKYNKKQQFEQNLGEWAGAVDIGKAETTRTIGISLANFYPNTSAILDAVMFRVRGLQNRSWSAFTQYGLNLQVPDPPTITGGKDENLATTAKFTWSLETDDKSVKVFTDVEYQSVLIAGCNETDGSKLDAYFNSRQTGWRTGHGGASDSRTITEASSDVASGSHTRWFRVRSRGPKGASAWRYAKFVYAAPNAANITKATATKLAAGGYQVSVGWTAASSAAYPIDQVTVDYSKAIPDANLNAPAGATWTTARTLKQSTTSNAVSFVVDGDLANDQVLFVRVNTEHESQNEPTNSAAKIAAYGKLKTPSISNISTVDSTYRATITVAKETDVPGAFTVILYRTADKPSLISTVGIIASGTSYTAQLPNWTGKTKQFGVYNAVGTYRQITRQDGTTSFEVTAKMTSDTEWDGGTVPNAPSEVTLRPTDIPGTVKVTWDWPWTEADSATISWSDHSDAWGSTDEPAEYTIENTQANEWNVSGLETGKRWFFRVRLTKGREESAINGAWSEIVSIDLSSAPSIPTLSLSAGIIPEKGSVAAFWSYVSTDGTAQAYAEICEATISGSGITYGRIIGSTQTAQHLTIYAEDAGWTEGETHYLCVRVVSASGRVSDDWSDPVPVIIAEPLEIEIENNSLETVHKEENAQTTAGVTIEINNPDGNTTVKDLKTLIKPVQDLKGYGKPWVGGSGKNKLKITATSATKDGVTFTVNSDGSVKVQGTTTSTNCFFNLQAHTTLSIPIGQHKFVTHSPDANVGMRIYVDSSSNRGEVYGENVTMATIPEGSTASWCRLQINGNGTTVNTTVYPMYCDASETDTSWVPYENICPISGRTQIEVTATGKNLLDSSLCVNRTNNGITTTVLDNGTISFVGTATAVSRWWSPTDDMNIPLKAGTYTLRPTNLYIHLKNGGYQNGTFTLQSDQIIDNLRFAVTNGQAYNTIISPQLEYGATATSKVPFGTTYQISLGRTVYGGTLDVTTGLLTVTHGLIDLGSLDWIFNNETNHKFFRTASAVSGMKTPSTASEQADIYCSAYASNTYLNVYNMVEGIGVSSTDRLGIYDPDAVSASLSGADFKAKVTGVTLVYPLATPQVYQLNPQTVSLLIGENNIWSNAGNVEAAFADNVRDYNALTEMPLTATITGAGNGGTTSLIIERARDYHVDRPDEEDFNGHQGETIAIITQTGEAPIVINRDDLLGALDDGAQYNLVATIQDGLGQSATETILFEVEWSHQAVMPEATVRIEEGVAVITPVQPTGYEEGDTVDIYRLSADKPELIIKGAEFGTAYVDPFPAFNEFGGHRVVYRTADGDYITADGELAWIDLQKPEGDYIKSISSVVDFDGTQIELLYDTTQSTSWTKDFRETRYLGGSVQGDWNKGVEVNSSLKTAKVTIKDQASMQAIRRLAAYPGVCHIRTVDGSSYNCDIQVSVDRQYDRETIRATYSLDIVKVDPEELDGQTYEEWQTGE